MVDEITRGGRVVLVELHAVVHRHIVVLPLDELRVAEPEQRMVGAPELMDVVA